MQHKDKDKQTVKDISRVLTQPHRHMETNRDNDINTQKNEEDRKSMLSDRKHDQMDEVKVKGYAVHYDSERLFFLCFVLFCFLHTYIHIYIYMSTSIS